MTKSSPTLRIDDETIDETFAEWIARLETEIGSAAMTHPVYVFFRTDEPDVDGVLFLNVFGRKYPTARQLREVEEIIRSLRGGRGRAREVWQARRGHGSARHDRRPLSKRAWRRAPGRGDRRRTRFAAVG
ncbi:MAG TPA: hypothetical protein VGG77_15090 [Roseiarcus sp.]